MCLGVQHIQGEQRVELNHSAAAADPEAHVGQQVGGLFGRCAAHEYGKCRKRVEVLEIWLAEDHVGVSLKVHGSP
jgi:hypothetical protein